MPTNTLTSLAILKVNVDHGRDYLDYLRPFVLQVLVQHRPTPVTDRVVSHFIQEQFGLVIPERTVQIVLKRISRTSSLTKKHGVYQITGDLPDPQLAAKQRDAELHIRAVVRGLCEFSHNKNKSFSGEDDAVAAICTFLAEFDITCLRSYLRGTAIPKTKEKRQTDIVLVSDYVKHIQKSHQERFNSFLVLVQGHMLANALMCPDLKYASNTYGGLTFYLDTPLLVKRLGSEGEAPQVAVHEMINLLNHLGGKVAAFSHSRDELERVLRGAADYLESPSSRGQIIVEARRNGTTKSDLLILAASIEDKLQEAGIEVEATPRYIEKFQIDETKFENVLKDEVSYLNPRAKVYDINSVRSIYVIRANKPTRSLEKSRAVLVTSNGGFARAAWQYGRKHESTKDVSSVITDFSLANMAWLKAPLGAPTIPTTQLLALSYAALKPSRELLGKYLEEIDRLKSQGIISERDHQLLRSSPLVYDELMDLTLGEDVSLTQETIRETLKRVSGEIRKEELGKLAAEQKAHRETQDALKSQRTQKEEIISKLYWRCYKSARHFANAVSGCMIALLAIGLLSGLGQFSGFGLSPQPPLSWLLAGGSTVVTLLTLMNLLCGSSVKNLHARVRHYYLNWLLKREAKTTGIDLSTFNIN